MEHYNERTISVTREKRMYGCANDYWIIIDEERYAKLSCGKTVEIKLDSNCRLPRLLTQQGLTTIERVDDAG